jgi:hypothetical protein
MNIWSMLDLKENWGFVDREFDGNIYPRRANLFLERFDYKGA